MKLDDVIKQACSMEVEELSIEQPRQDEMLNSIEKMVKPKKKHWLSFEFNKKEVAAAIAIVLVIAVLPSTISTMKAINNSKHVDPFAPSSSINVKEPNPAQPSNNTNGYKYVDLNMLNISLPSNFEFKQNMGTDYWEFNMDNNKNSGGYISAEPYKDSYEMRDANKKFTIVNEEMINISLGKCRFVTIAGADDSTGQKIEYNGYCGVVPVKDKAVYQVYFVVQGQDSGGQLKTQILQILNSLSLKNTDKVQDTNNFILKTDETDITKIAPLMMNKYFEAFKAKDIDDKKRITAYKVENIKGVFGDINKIGFDITYSVEPSNLKAYANKGNGKVKESWIENIKAFVEVEKCGEGSFQVIKLEIQK